jgi:hypothetical protein
MGGRWSGRQLHKLLHLCFEPLVLMRVFREGYNREGGQWRGTRGSRRTCQHFSERMADQRRSVSNTFSDSRAIADTPTRAETNKPPTRAACSRWPAVYYLSGGPA